MLIRRLLRPASLIVFASWAGAARAADCERAEPANAADTPQPGGSATSGPAQAPPTAAAALGRTPARVKCLDATLVDEFGRSRARTGVQPRYFRKARRLSFHVSGGMFAGDVFDTQWHVGGGVAFWIAEEFGIDADFKLTTMTLRLERAATGFTQENRYPDGARSNLAYIPTGHLLWAPLHTKLRSGSQRVTHGDFVVMGGAGPVFHRGASGVGVDLGMSFYLYPTKFLSLRIDLSDLIVAQEAFGSRQIANNLLFSLGVELWIPFRRRA